MTSFEAAMTQRAGRLCQLVKLSPQLRPASALSVAILRYPLHGSALVLSRRILETLSCMWWWWWLQKRHYHVQWRHSCLRHHLNRSFSTPQRLEMLKMLPIISPGIYDASQPILESKTWPHTLQQVYPIFLSMIHELSC